MSVTLYAAQEGNIVRALFSAVEAAQHPDPPPGAATTLAFDAESNPALVADLQRSTDAYRLQSGTLTKGGQPVTINPPPAATVERSAAESDLRDQYATAVQRLDAIIAGGFANNTARDAAISDLARILKRSLRLLKAQVG